MPTTRRQILNGKLAVSTAITLLATSVLAQAPYLVSDLNTTVATPVKSSNPTNFQMIGDTLYFQATLDETGTELWKYSNGQASIVADIRPGPGGSVPIALRDISNGVVLFFASDGVHGYEPWRTDGTTAGTALVKDINPGAASSIGGPITVYNNKYVFTANDGVHGAEPWISDGTEAGTRLLLDLDGTSASSGVTSMTVFGNNLLILGAGSLWTSDGTTAGTQTIATVGNAVGSAIVGSNALFFVTTAGGRELWKTDGTSSGTQKITDVPPVSSTFQSALAIIGQTLYFFAGPNGGNVNLWKTDGTLSGTQVVTSIPVGTVRFAFMRSAASSLFIELDDQLWRSDGTAAGTSLIEPNSVTEFAVAFDRAYYFVSSSAVNLLKWTDGVTSTVVSSSFFAYGASHLIGAGGKLYFAGSDRLNGIEPWVSDDGATVHVLVNVAPDGPPSSNPSTLTPVNNLMFFVANDGQASRIWRSDGTPAGTFPVLDIGGSFFDLFTPWNGALYFKKFYPELWKSDGTAAGTAVVKNFSQGFNTPGVYATFPGSAYLFLNADSGPGPRLWRTDGTTNGTISLGDMPKGPLYPGGFVELAGRVYFTASDILTGGIWVTDGTPANTKRVFNSQNQSASNLQTAGGALFFVMYAATTGAELWRTDGTVAGEALVKDILPGAASSNPSQLTGASRYLFFVANDGLTGAELWRSDGTHEGTILLKDIRPGASGSGIANLVAANDKVYFTADDGTHGVELWQSDGTSDGTVMVADINPGSASSNPQSLRFANGTLWFSANDGAHGTELWNATGGGASMAADLAPGADSSSPSEMAQAGSLLFFAASTSLGRELWALPLSDASLSVNDVRLKEGTGGTRTAKFTIARSGPTNVESTVVYATVDGTATSGSDYAAASGTLTFAAGETTKSVDVMVVSDSDIEPNESFFLVLSSPTSAVLQRSVGTAVIEDDDHRADLSIVFLPSGNDTSRQFRITNAGPSLATEVRIRFSESPFNFQNISISSGINAYAAGPQNPSEYVMDQIASGATVDIFVRCEVATGAYDVANPPGRTVTASVSSAEADPNPADNLTSSMLSGDGHIVLPPFLTTGSSTQSNYVMGSLIGTWSIPLESSNSIVGVSPATLVIPGGESSTPFTLTTGAATGRAVISAGTKGIHPYTTVTVPVVAPGTVAKLDVTIVAQGASVPYGSDATVTATVAARRHDGTLPTGTLTLLDNVTREVISQQTLDQNATVSVVRSGLPAGSFVYEWQYSGDANFNSLAGILTSVGVNGTFTATLVSLPPLRCAGVVQHIPITVRTGTTTTPTGSVRVTLRPQSGGAATLNVTLQLVPTGTQGEAGAVLNTTFPAGGQILDVTYLAPPDFNPSSFNYYFSVAQCAQMNLIATGTPSAVSLTWTAQTGAALYRIWRWSRWSQPVNVSTTGTTSYVDTVSLTPSTVYLYSVEALAANNATLAYANADLATTMTFSDDPVAAGSPIRKVHFDELRTIAAALRAIATGDTTYAAPFTVGAPIRASDIADIRADINTSLSILALPQIAFTDPALSAGTPIKAVHIQQLRDAVK